MNDATSTANSSGEQLSKRCVALLKMALKPDVWPNCELKLAWFDRLFQTADNTPAAATASAATVSAPNFTNICTALDLLTFLLSILRKEQILAGFKPLQRGLSSLMNCVNPKVIPIVIVVIGHSTQLVIRAFRFVSFFSFRLYDVFTGCFLV